MRALRYLWKHRKGVLAAVVLIYLVLIFGRFGDWAIIGPRPGHFDPGIAKRRWVTVNGKQVEVWVARSPALAKEAEPRGYVLEFCGNSTRTSRSPATFRYDGSICRSRRG